MKKPVRIIPMLEIKNGLLIKGINFEGFRVLGNARDFAQLYYKHGADEICYQDSVATLFGTSNLIKFVSETAKNVFVPLTVGGGIRSIKGASDMFKAGADKVAINSAAVNNPDIINEVTDKTGSQCIVAAVDAKKESAERWAVYTHGGRKKTELKALSWCIDLEKRGAGEILLTSMDKDGTKEGFDIDLLKTVSSNINIPLIASGGAGTLAHMKEAVINGKSDAVLAASIFHFCTYSVNEAKQYLKESGVAVRD